MRTPLSGAESRANPYSLNAVAPIAYRADIDGLRAVAILLVLAFHAFPDAVPGGFIGVDVFFTISGYLISGLVIAGLQDGTFTVRHFYARRIRRIFPALIVVLAATLAIGWLIMLPNEYEQVGKHVVASAGYVQNLILLTEAGYFDTASELKPLMHLWSLAVEEQFYLLYPLLLVWAWRTRTSLLATLVLVAGMSFILNLRETSGDPASAFFLPHLRFWELLVGAALACVHLQRKASLHAQASAISALGLLLILASAVLLDSSAQFPGWRALIPVSGAGMILHARAQAWTNQRLLASRPMVFVGLISYPLYLWHWPLLSMARVLHGHVLSDSVRAIVVLASFVLAWLTYRAVERPLRFGVLRNASVAWLVAALAAAALFGAWVFNSNGLPARAYPTAVEKFHLSLQGDPRAKQCFDLPHAYRVAEGWHCSFGPAARSPSLFAYGDSHALSLLPALERYAQERDVKVLFAGSSGCPPLLGIQSLRGAAQIERHDCRQLNERIFAFVRDNGIRQVLLVARWTYYAGGGVVRHEEFNPIAAIGNTEISVTASRRAFNQGLAETVAKYRSIGVHVILAQDTPQQLLDPRAALKQAVSPLSLQRLSLTQLNALSVSSRQHLAHQANVTADLRQVAQPLVSYVSFDDALCGAEVCQLADTEGFIYLDDDHLSVLGAHRVYPALALALATASAPSSGR